MKLLESLVCFLWCSIRLIAAQNQPSVQSLIVFGDGYSDIGNTFISTGNKWPQRPYFRGRFSNDQVWSELVSPPLNVPLFMYACGGSRGMTLSDWGLSNITNYYWLTNQANITSHLSVTIPSITQQIEDFLSVPTDKILRSLVVVFFSGAEFLDDASLNPYQIIRAFRGSMYSLLRNGVRNIVLTTLPPLDRFPGVHLDRIRQHQLREVVDTYNKEIISLASFFARRRKVVLWDVHRALTEVLDNGPFRVTYRACLHTTPEILPGKQCKNVEDYLFWDPVHVTFSMHRLLAKSFIHQVITAWPDIHVWGDV